MKPFALVAGLAVLLACSASSASGGRSSDPAAKDYVGPKLPLAHVVIPDAFGGKHRLEVELAQTPEARERGLMWRTQLGDKQGMLFIFPDEEEQSFWMRNTLISLDMLFITQERKLVGVVNDAAPQTTTPRGVGKRTLYVLEVPGGWAAKNGIKLGADVQFEGVPFGPANR